MNTDGPAGPPTEQGLHSDFGSHQPTASQQALLALYPQVFHKCRNHLPSGPQGTVD